MLTYYLIPPTEQEVDYDHPAGTLHISFGGIYFFLYPYLLQVKDKTGQMLDPQYNAKFTAEMFPVVLDELNEARKAAESSPALIVVHVGKQITPTAKELYENVSRSDLLKFIDSLIALFEDTASKNCSLYLTEY